MGGLGKGGNSATKTARRQSDFQELASKLPLTAPHRRRDHILGSVCEG